MTLNLLQLAKVGDCLKLLKAFLEENGLPKFELTYVELEKKHIFRKTGGHQPNLARVLWLLMLPLTDKLYSVTDVVGYYLSADDDPKLYKNCQKALESASYRMGRRQGDEIGPDNLDPVSGKLIDKNGNETTTCMWRPAKWRLIVSDESNNRAYEFMERLKAFAKDYPEGTRFYADFHTLELSAVLPNPKPIESDGHEDKAKAKSQPNSTTPKEETISTGHNPIKNVLGIAAIIGLTILFNFFLDGRNDKSALSKEGVGQHFDNYGYSKATIVGRPKLAPHLLELWQGHEDYFGELERLAALGEFY